ncbi:MAG: hypothetical protein WC254_04840 [Candidatus Woesearchaeota archaeon]|jgi:hypothetical protein
MTTHEITATISTDVVARLATLSSGDLLIVTFPEGKDERAVIALSLVDRLYRGAYDFEVHTAAGGYQYDPLRNSSSFPYPLIGTAGNHPLIDPRHVIEVDVYRP